MNDENECGAFAGDVPPPETSYVDEADDRRRAEERLREYEKVVEGLEDMIVVVDREYRYLLANRAFLSYRGMKREEIVGHLVSEILNKDIFEEIVRKRLDECFQGKVVKYELTYNHIERGERQLSISYFPIEGPHGIDRVACVLKDVTELRRAEDLVIKREYQLAEAQHLAHVGSWNWDLVSGDRTWSDELYHIFGLARDGSALDLPATLAQCVHPDDREFVKSSIERSIENKEACNFSYRIVRPDGAERIIHSRGNVVTDKNGDLIRMFGTAQDVTERNCAEQAISEAERKYREIFDNANEGIFQSTPEGQYVAANPALARMYGFASPEELIRDRKNITQTYVTPQRREEFKSLLSKHGIVRGFEHQIFHADGSKIWVSVNARAVRDGRGQIVYYEGTVQDITERKRTEAALRESEELFSRAFHSSPAPLIITRLADGLFLNANDAFLRAFEYERAEVIGQTVAALNIYVSPGDRKSLLGKLQDSGALREFESRARTKSGRILDLLVFVEPVTLYGEQCLLSTAYDITDRKQVEEALRESEERYRELFENAKDAIYVHDLSGRYTSVNRAAEKLSGYSRAEIIGKHYSKFMAPSHLKHARTNLVKKLDEVPETNYEIDLITKDRRRVPVEVSSRLIYENGVPVGVQGTARDITERQLAEQARAQLALIVESSHDAIIGKTLDGTIVSWNSGAAKIYGYLAEEVIGRSVSLLIPPERRDDLPRIMEILRRGESIKNYETTRHTKGGNVIDVSLTISPIRDSLQNLVGASTIARDITSSKQAEKGLKTFSRRLIEAQEAERQSIARELHDEIGQVLTAVRINLQSIQRSGLADQNNPRFDESVAIVDEALGRVRDLSIELRPSLLDDLGLYAALRWYVDRYAQRTGIIAEVLNGFEEDGRLPRELETACFRIAQEALTNVARHAQAGSVSVQLERSWDRMFLTVMDDGVGFDLDSMRKNTVAASALGLRGMEERALAVGGHIEIDSGSGRGTRVRASFPLRPD